MSTWYSNFFASPATGTTHNDQPATSVPAGTLCYAEAHVVYDWQVTTAQPGQFVRNAQAGFGLNWVNSGGSRPSLATANPAAPWLFWGGLYEGEALAAFQIPGTFSNLGMAMEREARVFRWRGARQIPVVHDWWAQTSVNFISTPDASGSATWWIRLGYW